MTDTLLDQADALMRRRRPPSTTPTSAPPPDTPPADIKADHQQADTYPPDAARENETTTTDTPGESDTPDAPDESDAPDIPDTTEIADTENFTENPDDFPLLTEIVTPICGETEPAATLSREQAGIEHWLDEQIPRIVAQVLAENLPALTAQVIERIKQARQTPDAP